MSADDAFTILLRGAAFLLWSLRLLRIAGGMAPLSRNGRLVGSGSLVLLLGVLFLAAVNTGLGLPLEAWVIRTLVTAATAVTLMAGIVLWR